MNLTKDKYVVSGRVLTLVLEALSNNWFVDDRNNDDIIEAEEDLKKDLELNAGLTEEIERLKAELDQSRNSERSLRRLYDDTRF